MLSIQGVGGPRTPEFIYREISRTISNKVEICRNNSNRKVVWACPVFLDLDFSWLFMDGVGFEVHRGLITQSAVESFWVIERFDVIEEC